MPGRPPHARQAAAMLEAVANLLDDEDDDRDAGYGQIMIGMTNPRQDRPRQPG